MTATLKVHFDGKVLVPVEPVDLPTDRILEVEVRESGQPSGSPAAILKALKGFSPVAADDLAAMEKAIDEAKLPVKDEGAFDDPQERE